jgi:hypothetical protein
VPFVTVRSRWSHSEALHTSPATQTEILHWHTLHGMWLCGRSLASYIGRCNKAALVGGGGGRACGESHCRPSVSVRSRGSHSEAFHTTKVFCIGRPSMGVGSVAGVFRASQAS